MTTYEEQRAIERKKRLGYIGMAGFVGLIIVCLLVISIIGEELERNKDYLTYMWIQDTGDAGDTSYIYVPSGEFGMPIQEAMRLNKIQKELE